MNRIQRVAIYARFSTDKQRDASIEDQIDSCCDEAARKGWQIVEIYSDRAVSGASMFRAGIEALQRDARAGIYARLNLDPVRASVNKATDVMFEHMQPKEKEEAAQEGEVVEE